MSYPFSVSADEFKGKRVLVTGGTKGMGALIVERFVASGASVATTARSPLPADQRPTLFIQADIGSRDGTEAVIEGVNREWGGIDILINCVGGSEAPNGGFRRSTVGQVDHLPGAVPVEDPRIDVAAPSDGWRVSECVSSFASRSLCQ